MENTLPSKTVTSSLPQGPRLTFDWIADPQNLQRWYGSLAQLGPIRFIRDDRACVLDLIATVYGIELPVAIRVLPNGDGSEIVMTLVQPRDISDAAFATYIRGASSALGELKAIQQGQQPPAAPLPLHETIVSAPASGRKLFVGNLPFAWTDELLKDLFAAQGTVASAVIARLRGRGGRSRGFGFVEMSTELEAQTAVEKLHDSLAGERKIIVRLSRSQESHTEKKSQDPASETPGDGSAAAEQTPPQVRRQTSRPQRPQRGAPSGNRRGGNVARPSGRGPRPDAPRRGSARPSRDTGITNNSGYEIYPRNSQGGFDSEPTPRSAAVPPSSSSSSIEPSPYMEDTGDIENRGNRSPRPRRR